MEWSRIPPLEDGHYWYRENKKEQPVMLKWYTTQQNADAFGYREDFFPDRNIHGEWFGPIPCPVDFSDET